MDADSINNSIDNVFDVSEKLAEKYLLDVALNSILGVTTGFFARLLTPIIKKILEKTAFEFLRYLKRKGQKRIDIIEGKMIIREVADAVQNSNEQDYIIGISKY